MKLPPELIDAAKKLRLDGKSFVEIAKEIGDGIKPHQVRRALISRNPGKTHRVRDGRGGYVNRNIPEHVLVERERVMSTRDNWTLDQEYLGDPPPGRSALDQKRK